MNTLSAHAPGPTPRTQRPGAAARTVLRLLQLLRHGHLQLHLPNGERLAFGDSASPMQAVLQVHQWRVFSQVLRSGDIGFAESYVAGDWGSPDLAALLRLLLANRQELQRVIHGSWLGRWTYRLRHLMRRNTRHNSRQNIHAHYDLGNAFYRLWLDPSMNYSSALFEGQFDLGLQAAQDAKVRRALHMAGVKRGSRVLEIGCGWGALAEKACGEFQARLTGVTLSTEQLAFAEQRLQSQGLHTQADLRLQDYRDIADGPYDAVCSIEMIEAVGQAYWPTYFERIAQLLKPGGRACIQGIVIREDLFDQYIRSTDFIQQYIFPGGCLPTRTVLIEQARQAGLELIDDHGFGRDYAETCRRWRQDFLARREAILGLGFDERFMRIWEFYLVYCEAGFDAGDIDVAQFSFIRSSASPTRQTASESP